MTVTLGGLHLGVDLSEARQGRRIGKGFGEDLRDLNRQIIHEFAANGSTALAVLNVPAGITTATTSYGTIATAKVRVWGNGARLNLHIYGNQSRVRVTVGGVVLGTAANTLAGDAWASMGAVNLSGATFDADGFVIVLLELQDTTGSPSGTPTLYHAVLAEELMQVGQLPSASNTQTDFRAMHDELYNSTDYPLDNFAMQKLNDNAEFMLYERARRICQLMPLAGNVWQIVRLSSCYWRLDGPYVIQVPPHCDDGISACVTLAVSSSPASVDMDVFMLTEFEEFEQVRASRVQTISASAVQYLKFEGMKAKAGQPCMVWVAFKSEVDTGAATTSITGYSWSAQKPETLYSQRNVTMHTAVNGTDDGIPWGYVGVLSAEDVIADKDAAIKNALGYTTPELLIDFASMQGEDNSGGTATDRADVILISPHPGTGIIRGVSTSPPVKWWTATPSDVVDPAAIEVRRCAIGFLYGVYIECVGSWTAPSRQKLARARRPPAASLLQVAANRCNQMVYNGNSQVLLRHGGARNLLTQTLVGGTKPTNFAGAYLFAEGAGAGTTTGSYLWTIPIAEPNVSGGLDSLTLWGQFIFMATMWSGQYPSEEHISYRCKFTGSDWFTGSTPNIKVPSHGAQQSPTQADALAAMFSTAVYVGSSPQESTANSYGQCYTWSTEGNFRRSPWSYSVPFSDDSQPSFPTIMTAEIELLGGGSGLEMRCNVAIAGLHVWWGPREE